MTTSAELLPVEQIDPKCLCCCRLRSEHERGQCPETTYFVPNNPSAPQSIAPYIESVREALEQALRNASKSPAGGRIRILADAIRQALSTLPQASADGVVETARRLAAHMGAEFIPTEYGHEIVQSADTVELHRDWEPLVDPCAFTQRRGDRA